MVSVNINDTKNAVVAISGGVDSAVAALILKQQGFNVIGLHAVCYDSTESYCTSQNDRLDAIKIAKQLDIPLCIVDLQKEYKDKIINYLVSEYDSNRTPNPDVLCNRDIKFDLLFKHANHISNNCFFSTGHYAKILDGNLMIPADKSKDQTYFLWMVPKDTFKKVLFPLQDFTKSDVRKIAKNNNLVNHDKKDSQGICFVGEVGIFEFLKDKIISKPGIVFNLEGKAIGSHKGSAFYTIGQRHGFNIHTRSSNSKAMYIYKKTKEGNSLTVAPKEYLYKTSLSLTGLNEFAKIIVRKKYMIRIRHLGELIGCQITRSNNNQNQLNIELEKRVFAVAPGQSAVIYDGIRVVAGGFII